MARYLGIILAGALLAALVVQGCNVSPIPLPLPYNEAGMSDIMGTKNDAGANNDGIKLPDLAAPDAMPPHQDASQDAKIGDGAVDGAPDGTTDGTTDGSPGDAEVDIKSPEATVVDLCGEC